MKFAIFGSGFGLYGYLPALIEGCGQTVCLPKRYQTRLAERADVRRFGEQVIWGDDDAAVLQQADAVLVSQRPADQERWIADCVQRAGIGACLLEKPLAATPAGAGHALDLLEASGKKLRIGYNFRFTPWAAALLRDLPAAGGDGTLHIDWQFKAHHYANDLANWKRSVSEGGGALRFFGIHLVGLLAELGYDTVVSSQCRAVRPDECETWTAVFAGAGLPECSVRVATNDAETHYHVDRIRRDGGRERLVALRDPFEASATFGEFDRRFGILTDVCRDLIDGPAASYPWYRQSVKLWDGAERLS